MAEPLSAVLAIVKSTWQTIDFFRNTVQAPSSARHLWERTNDLVVFIKKIELVVNDHPEPFDKDIVSIVQKALAASNQTLDRLARRCLNIGDKEDLALVHRITRPIYFTLSSKSIQKFEHELQMHIMSVQMAFYLLDRGENQKSTRRITSTLAMLEQHVGRIAQQSSLTYQGSTGQPHLAVPATQHIDKWVETPTNTLVSAFGPSWLSQALDTDDTDAPISPLERLTTQETRAWGSIDRHLSGITIDEEGFQASCNTAIVDAIKDHSLHQSQHLLEDSAGLNGADNHGLTPLMYTVFEHGKSCDQCTDYMKQLLNCGVKINTDSRGGTALHMAIEHTHLEAAKLLLQGGADVDASYPNTPLMMAIRSNKSLFVELFLVYQPDIHVTDDANWGLVHHAVWRNSKEALGVLLSKDTSMGLNLNLNARCQMDWTPLMHLAENAQRPANIDLAQMLLDHGADVDATDTSGYSALYYTVTAGAASPRRGKFARLLIQRGANIEAVRSQVSKRVIDRFPLLKPLSSIASCPRPK